VDLISALARAPEGQSPPEQAAWQSDADSFVRALAQPTVAPVPVPRACSGPQPSAVEEAIDRSLRVSAENLNRMLDLAGETLVESHRLRPSNRRCCASSGCSARRRCRSKRWKRLCPTPSMNAPGRLWPMRATNCFIAASNCPTNSTCWKPRTIAAAIWRTGSTIRR
jgi:hypothetical protein